MAFDVPTIVAADNGGNDTDYNGWVKMVALAGAANAGQLSGFRNRIINGAMAIDQRNGGAVQNITGSITYCVDRFAVVTTTTPSGTLTAQRVATAGATESPFALRLARTSGTYAGGFRLLMALETANCADLAGKKIILSFKARKGSAFTPTVSPYVITGNGSDQSLANMLGGAWTGYAAPGIAAPTLTTSYQTFSGAVTLGASVSQIGLQFNIDSFSGTGGANDYVDFTDFQIEPCDATVSRSSPYERRPVGLELALCQRYFEKSLNQGVAVGAASTAGAIYFRANGTNHLQAIQFQEVKRTTPTVTLYNPNSGAAGSWRDYAAGTDKTVTTGSIGEAACYVDITSSVDGNYVAGHYTASAEL